MAVAKNLLGKYLCRRYRGKVICRMITEVEAYDGLQDRASHASRGMTQRNEIMFGPAGYWYVYFTYGLHWMLNIVTGERGYPAAVLIRGVQSIDVRRQYIDIEGPGRVTKFFKIDKRFNNKKASPRTDLWIEDKGVKVKKSQIKIGKRIGVDYAGPIWSKKPWRFYLK